MQSWCAQATQIFNYKQNIVGVERENNCIWRPKVYNIHLNVCVSMIAPWCWQANVEQQNVARDTEDCSYVRDRSLKITGLCHRPRRTHAASPFLFGLLS